MSKEYVWTLGVDGVDTPWRCVVTDDECITYEADVETNRLKIEEKEAKVGVLQIDDTISIFGQECPFQLENNVPYIMIKGKWEMSDTSLEERSQKFLKNQIATGWVQFAIGLVICAIVLVIYLVKGEIGNWWFGAILGSIFALTGILQVRNIKKECKI